MSSGSDIQEEIGEVSSEDQQALTSAPASDISYEDDFHNDLESDTASEHPSQTVAAQAPMPDASKVELQKEEQLDRLRAVMGSTSVSQVQVPPVRPTLTAPIPPAATELLVPQAKGIDTYASPELVQVKKSLGEAAPAPTSSTFPEADVKEANAMNDTKTARPVLSPSLEKRLQRKTSSGSTRQKVEAAPDNKALLQKLDQLERTSKTLHTKNDRLRVEVETKTAQIAQLNRTIKKLEAAPPKAPQSRIPVAAPQSMDAEEKKRLQKELEHQERLIIGYQKENEKLMMEKKNFDRSLKEKEDAHAKSLQALQRELREYKEKPQLQPVIIDNGRRDECDRCRLSQEEKHALDIKLHDTQAQLQSLQDNFQRQIVHHAAEKEAKLQLAENANKQLSEKVAWYVSNQRFLDDNDKTVRELEGRVKTLDRQLKALHAPPGVSTQTVVTLQAKRLRALEERLQEAEDVISRKGGDKSLRAEAAKLLAQNDLQKMRELASKVKMAEKDRSDMEKDMWKQMRVLRQEFNQMKAFYEQRLKLQASPGEVDNSGSYQPTDAVDLPFELRRMYLNRISQLEDRLIANNLKAKPVRQSSGKKRSIKSKGRKPDKLLAGICKAGKSKAKRKAKQKPVKKENPESLSQSLQAASQTAALELGVVAHTSATPDQERPKEPTLQPDALPTVTVLHLERVKQLEEQLAKLQQQTARPPCIPENLVALLHESHAYISRPLMEQQNEAWKMMRSDLDKQIHQLQRSLERALERNDAWEKECRDWREKTMIANLQVEQHELEHMALGEKGHHVHELTTRLQLLEEQLHQRDMRLQAILSDSASLRGPKTDQPAAAEVGYWKAECERWKAKVEELLDCVDALAAKLQQLQTTPAKV